jgi:sulfide dehydrogenase cytochrome subunit
MLAEASIPARFLPFDRKKSMLTRKIFLAFCCGTLLLAEVGSADGADGRIIGVSCNGCHGPNGESQGAIPSLSNLSAEQIESALLAFKSRERSATIMGRISRGYTRNEIVAVAVYFANLK